MNRIKVIVSIAMDGAGVANRARQLFGGKGALLRTNTDFWRLQPGANSAKFQQVFARMSGANVLV